MPYTGWTFGHFFTLIFCKNGIVCLERPKIKEKEAGVGPFVKRLSNDWVQLKKARKLLKVSLISVRTSSMNYVNHRDHSIHIERPLDKFTLVFFTVGLTSAE